MMDLLIMVCPVFPCPEMSGLKNHAGMGEEDLRSHAE